MKSLARIALVVGILLAAWFISRRGSHDAGEVAEITVTSDPAALAAAQHAWGLERERQLAELLAHPESIYPEFSEQAVLIAADRPRIVATLAQLRDDAEATPTRRVSVGIALLALGEAGSIDQLVGMAGTDPAARSQLLLRLDALVPHGEPIPASLHPMILEELENPRSGPSLARDAALHGMHEAGDTITRLAMQAPPAGDPWLAAAALLQPTPEIVDLASSRLGPGQGFAPPPGLQALVNAATSTEDPALAETALLAVVGQLRAQEDVEWIDGATMGAVEALARLPPAAGAAALADLAVNARWMHLRRTALTVLGTVDAARAAEIAKQTGLDIDGKGTGRAPSGMTATRAAEICTRHGLIDAAAADAALAAMRENSSLQEIEDEARGFLTAARVYTSFDVETGTVPNRHDLLILELAGISGGRFRPEAVLETYEVEDEDAETGKYAVQFIHGGRLYSFEPEDLGDWYDVDMVLAAIERALEDAGSIERYVVLEPDGQSAELVFADPAKIRAAAPELGLVLGDDAAGAMRLGKEFEARVLETIR